MNREKRIDGQNVLYHYIQKNLLRDDSSLSEELLKRFLLDTSIWLPPIFYKQLPIILPYVVRDYTCRGRINGKEQWGMADNNGFLRDDNSLVKGIPRSFTVESSHLEYYDGLRMGNGFVASHIWGKVAIDGNQYFSSRIANLNSFVLNLVWLPSQLSKLTDRESSFAQRFLQVVSHKLYRKIQMPELISKVWDSLPFPAEFEVSGIDVSKVAFFSVSEGWLKKRIDNLISEIDLIVSATTDNTEREKIKCRRYLPSLVRLSSTERTTLNEWLNEYRSVIQNASQVQTG